MASPAKNVSFPRHKLSFYEGKMPGNTFDAKSGKKTAKNRHCRESDGLGLYRKLQKRPKKKHSCRFWPRKRDVFSRGRLILFYVLAISAALPVQKWKKSCRVWCRVWCRWHVVGSMKLACRESKVFLENTKSGWFFFPWKNIRQNRNSQLLCDTGPGLVQSKR